jgi:cytochrome c biogenesis protein CcdA
LDDDVEDRGARVLRAVSSAAAVSFGFLLVFATLGIPINAGATSIYRWMPWLTIVIGLALVALGIAMLAGWKPVVLLPRLDRGGRSRRFGSMVLFGISYAIASLGCTLPIFLLVVTAGAATSSALSFVAYSLGMTVILMTVSLAIALARESLVRTLRRATRYVDRASGTLLVLVGTYLVWYGRYAIDPANSTASSPLAWVESWSSRATVWLHDGGTRLGLVLGIVIVAVVGVVSRRSRRP